MWICEKGGHCVDSCDDCEHHVEVEIIVRCKFCKYFDIEPRTGIGLCMRPIAGEDYSETGYLYPLEVPVNLEGYCNYGSRKE